MDRPWLGSGGTHTHQVAPLPPKGERAVTLRQALKKLCILVLHLDSHPYAWILHHAEPAGQPTP